MNSETKQNMKEDMNEIFSGGGYQCGERSTIFAKVARHFAKFEKKSGMIRHDEKGSLHLRGSEEGVDEARSTAEAWPTLCRSLICGRAF